MTESSRANSLPPNFESLAAAPPPDLRISMRIIDPVLIVRKSGAGYQVGLGGKRRAAGKSHVLEALSMAHNWVLDGETVRPLPKDICSYVKPLLKGKNPAGMSFPGVLELLRSAKEQIAIEIDDGVLAPAKLSAGEMQGSRELPGLNARLYPYQAEGVAWMRETLKQTGGLILADEMGLGKTLQIIALLVLDPPSEVSPALIICPTSLIANWRREIMKFAPALSILLHRGPKRAGIFRDLQRSQIVITTYETLANDIAIFSSFEWSFVVCDEAQAIKNPDARRRAAIASVPRKRCIPMTGTPVENSLLDLWSLTDIAIPGLLGTKTGFESDYPDDEASARAVARLTDPVIIRRRVVDVADDLPERIDVDVPIELGDDLVSHYNEIREEIAAKYPVAGALVATGQLQIFCAHPWLVSRDTSEIDGGSGDVELVPAPRKPLMTPKLERTIDLLREAFANQRKVLIFALFNKCYDLLRDAADDLTDAYWWAINGSTPQEDRQSIVDSFSEHDGPGVLVLNPKAAGAGLNITAATVVIHYTQVWNPALEAQASARAHRRGQDQPVTIYRLYYQNTVEEVMIERSQWKRELGNEAVPIGLRNEADLKRILETEAF